MLAVAPLLSVALVLAVVSSAFGDALTPESGGSPNADRIDSLYKITLAIAAVVFVGVEGALLYSLLKFRARKGRVAAQIRGNTNLEIGWTVGAAVVLVFLTVFTFIKLGGIVNPEPSGAGSLAGGQGVLYAAVDQKAPPGGRQLRIGVNGQQYVWRYTYDDGDDNPLNDIFAYTEMVVPKGTTVTLEIRAQDVMHSWWIPALGGKFDAVPGHTNHTWFKVPLDSEESVFNGQCAELCGRNHANMIASVRALDPPAFEAWLAEKRREIQGANRAAQVQRREVEGEQTNKGNRAP